MKPGKLLISAFGPYTDRMPVIDFRSFHLEKPFLITGDTGAGKTTIFDAICFALYGTASGEYRKAEYLRCENAAPGAESFVEFEFTHQGRTYVVKRWPSYMRPKLRGEGVIEEPEKVELTCDGTPIPGRVKDINVRLEEILKLNVGQFKQVAMLAQGEFWKLLNASTEERTKILRTIFNTTAYQKMEIVLKDKLDAAYGQRNDLESFIRIKFGEVETAEEGELSEELQRRKEQCNAVKNHFETESLLGIIDTVQQKLEERLEQICDRLKLLDAERTERIREINDANHKNEAVVSFLDLQAKQEELQSKRESFEERRSRLQKMKAAVNQVRPVFRLRELASDEVRKDEKELEVLQKRMKELEETLVLLQEQDGDILRMQEQIEMRKLEVSRLSEEEPKYQERDEHLRRLGELRKQFDTVRKEETRAKERLEEIDKAIERYSTQEKQLMDVPEKKQKLEALQERRESLLALMEKTLTDGAHLKELDQRLQQAGDAYKAAFQVFDRASKAYVEAHRVRLQNSAGILAESLREGEKCPVCGSLHHPEPATISLREAISDKDLEEKKEAMEKADEDQRKALTTFEGAKSTRNAAQVQLEELIRNCEENSFYPKEMGILGLEETEEKLERLRQAKEWLFREYTGCEEQVRELGAQAEALSEARQKLAVLRDTDRKEGEAALEKITLQLQECQGRLSEEEGRKESFAGLSYASLEAAKEAVKQALLEIRAFEKKKADQEEQRREAEGNLAGAKGSRESVAAALTKHRHVLEERNAEFFEALGKAGFQEEKQFEEYNVVEETIVRLEEEIGEYDRRTEEIRAKMETFSPETRKGEKIDISILEEALKSTDQQMEQANRMKEDLTSAYRRNHDSREEIAGRESVLERARAEYEKIKRLYDLVRGTTRNGKLTLEQYVQAEGFDRIIHAANRRLQTMTNNQFTLYRQESLSNQSKQFLNLEVFDRYTGKKRPVSNLSGGESFKAALSLALGLSDTVTSNAGGVQMDALFVDEGFGTLDRESLNSALEVLIRLSGANKVVGVISHREELMDEIRQMIRVTKTTTGSEFCVITEN